jgi:mRNA interferase YafQ
MPSPKTERKRANRPYRADYGKEFDKDWQRLTRSGRYNMNQLKEVILLIVANAGPLPPERHDHLLTGNWADHRECHIGGDFLLIYKLDGDTARFVRAGTHAELFD